MVNCTTCNNLCIVMLFWLILTLHPPVTDKRSGKVKTLVRKKNDYFMKHILFSGLFNVKKNSLYSSPSITWKADLGICQTSVMKIFTVENSIIDVCRGHKCTVVLTHCLTLKWRLISITKVYILCNSNSHFRYIYGLQSECTWFDNCRIRTSGRSKQCLHKRRE